MRKASYRPRWALNSKVMDTIGLVRSDLAERWDCSYLGYEFSQTMLSVMADKVEVTVYTRQLCGFCTAAKNLLSSKGVDFTEKDASYDPVLRQEMVKRSEGGSTFPQIFIGDIHVGGCDDLMAMERAGNLDGLLKL